MNKATNYWSEQRTENAAGKGLVAGGGKLTRDENRILKDGLKSRPAGKAYDKELIRLQNMYPNYFPKA